MTLKTSKSAIEMKGSAKRNPFARTNCSDFGPICIANYGWKSLSVNIVAIRQQHKTSSLGYSPARIDSQNLIRSAAFSEIGDAPKCDVYSGPRYLSPEQVEETGLISLSLHSSSSYLLDIPCRPYSIYIWHLVHENSLINFFTQ